MIEALLTLAPGALGLLALIAALIPKRARRVVLVALPITGAGFSVALFIFAGSGDTWRTIGLAPEATVIASALFCAWLSVAVTAGVRAQWRPIAHVGIASCGLTLAVTNNWIVPTLLFWVASSLALAALLRGRRGPLFAWCGLFISDAAFVAGLVGFSLENDVWQLSGSLTGWQLYCVLGAAIVRSGALPGIGAWGFLGPTSASAIPLLTGSSFAAVSLVTAPADRAAAVVALVLSLAFGIWSVARRGLSMSMVGSSAIALLLGCALVSPQALPVAGLGAVVAATGVALWPPALGRGSVERALLLAPFPLSSAFLGVAIAGAATLATAFTAEGAIDKVSWAALGFLLIAAAVACGAGAARVATHSPAIDGDVPADQNPERHEIWPRTQLAWTVIVLRVFALGSVAAALFAPEVFETSERLPLASDRDLGLFGAAVLAAGLFAWVGGRRPSPHVQPRTEPVSRGRPEPAGRLIPRLLTAAVLVLAIGVAGAVGFLTVEGLRVGFL